MISRYLTSRDENNQQSNEENLYEDEENIEELPLKWYQKVFKAVFPLKTDPKSEIIRKLILIFAVPIFLISGFFVTKYYIDSYNNDQLIQSLKNKYNETTTVPQEKKDEIGYPSDYIDSFFELYKQNKDVKGYIKIDGTAIDFPIVQYTDNDYYLRRDFNKKNSDHGIPFFDFRVDLKRPATNFLIYGHNMHDKQMFNEILNYKNLDYYKNHPIITMDTVYEKSQWKVFAAYVANASSEDGPVFQYHNFINCTNETIYNNFIDQVELRSIIQTGVDVKYGDQLLTLSTCTYEIGSGRFVVMARKVRPGESTSVNTSSATLNPAPLYPDKWYEK
ncbi:MAG: class B sortase, partial [Clostridia bacterium]